MNNLIYEKRCDASGLDAELQQTGFIKAPTSKARFYGVSTSGDETTVHGFDDLSDDEVRAIDAIVDTHDPTITVKPVE